MHLRLGKPGIAHITLEHMLDVLDEDSEHLNRSVGDSCFSCCLSSSKRHVLSQYRLANHARLVDEISIVSVALRTPGWRQIIEINVSWRTALGLWMHFSQPA